MQKVESQTYWDLARELLGCSHGEEQVLLSTRPELTKLIEILLAVEELLGRLGQVKQTIYINNHNEKIRFLADVLQLAAQNNGNPQMIYSFLQKNLWQLDDQLLPVLESWAVAEFNISRKYNQQSIANAIIKFGDLVQQFSLGNKAVNIDLSIGCYDIALKVFTVFEDAQTWALIQNNRALALSEKTRGDRADNLEKAILAYQASLEIRNKNDFPTQWAMTQFNLALAFSKRIRENRRNNLEQAIYYYKSALEIYTKKVFPFEWAKIQMNLANTYSDRIEGNRADNLEKAITCYESALEIYNRQDSPIERVMTLNNYGSAYRTRLRGNRADNLEKTITCYESVLEIYTRKDFPMEWAGTQNNLALALINRIKGDKAENLEKAIFSGTSALEIYNKKDFPSQWSMAKNSIANAYSDRIEGDRANNLEKAITCYESSLEVYTRKDFPVEWAMTNNNIASVYNERIEGDRAENLEKAISIYKLILEVYTKKDFPFYWAMIQNNLANAYNDRIEGDKAENLEKAIVACASALEIYTKEDFPIEWAMIQNNLANVYNDRIEGDKVENLEKAIVSYSYSLEIRTPQNMPIDCLQSARNLGDVYFTQGNWQQAITTYEIAMQAAETSRVWSMNDSERQRVLSKALSVYENAIQCAVNLKDYKRAIEYTERVRSRQLVELMASKDLYSNAQVPTEIQAYLVEYQQLNQSIKDLCGDGTKKLAISKNHDSEDLRKSSEQIQQAEARKQFLYRQIRTYDPVLAGQIEVTPISHSDIQKLITNAQTAILVFYSTDNNTHIFILKQNQEPAIFTVQSQGKQELLNWLIKNWTVPYNQKDNALWRKQMPTVLAELTNRLQINQLITNHLASIQELVLVPHLLLHQIPFAALPIAGSPTMLGEKFVVRFIPSCQILQYCQQRPEITTTIQGLVEDADETLIGARYEGHKIAEICEVKEGDRLRGKTQATVANYRLLLGRVNRLHSSHHAATRWDNPLESALKLGDGNITLGDLLLGERYPNLDEVFLSACETHVGNITFTDDVATITTGFLCAGARSVQSTLWSVSDLVTAIFDILYHQERREGYNRAFSLKRAQVRLKNLSGEEFKISHAEGLLDFLSEQLAIVSQQIAELKAEQKSIDMDQEEDRWSQLNDQIMQLVKEEKKLKVTLPNLLKEYCEADRPFASPYFWAGFICQGIA
jgi:CHAT domain-containing protein